ncbi:cation diffusion facilitator family transporter [Steroidobacter agaridevorans]|uniref:cation diffusion facilitator family transporter n=1 Tax=Steroidobacter agaridevorans TaxID=2695856 RepID=UPI0013794C73|nr:cation diffusion facilitator family transporter [Steroidobacter agaridevorans]
MNEHRHEHGDGHAHDHGHSHDHDHDHSAGASGKVLGVAFALTASFMLVEFAGGLLARSLALVADAGHMLTDAAALALAWAAVRIATRPADAKRSFGYQRLRVLATFVNGCALLFIVAWIAFEAIARLLNPVPVNASAILWIGTLGFAVNLLVFAMLRRGDSHDMNVSAATMHVLSDLLGSAAAIVAALVILWTGWMPIDPLLSLFVSALIVKTAISLVRRSAHILMEGSPEWLDQGELRRTLEQKIPAIRDVHHVHTWSVGPHETLLTMHALVNGSADQAMVLKDTKALLAERFGITHATIQIEVEDCVDKDCAEEPPIKRARG